MKTFIVQENSKLSKIVQKQGVGHVLLQKLLRKKDIKINGKRVSQDTAVLVGDKIELYIPDKKLDLAVVYKDDNLVVFNKPQGIESQDFFQQVLKEYPTAIFTHRLDRNTGGLIVFALNQPSYEQLYLAIKERTLDKYYLAMVVGKMPRKQAVLTAYCKKDSASGFVTVFDDYQKGRLKMITEYSVVAEDADSSLLSVKLVTGRTHQIRAHLAHEGHFIVGDGKYGKESINKLYSKKYQQLFAYKIVFNFDGGVLGYLDKKEIVLDVKL